MAVALHTSPSKEERPDVLPGSTYKRKIVGTDGDINVYITICDQDGRPFEMFLNASNARFVEQVSVIMIFASRLLQAGVPVSVIADDLCDIHSPFTGHMTSNGYCPSLSAAIGEVFRSHTLGN